MMAERQAFVGTFHSAGTGVLTDLKDSIRVNGGRGLQRQVFHCFDKTP